MSASLVGSEMCIRDSSRAPRAWTQRRSLASGRALREALEAAPGPLAAVSYTHLTLPTICSV
eukprot:14414828-Alexandrium_andersonii.AAC.1